MCSTIPARTPSSCEKAWKSCPASATVSCSGPLGYGDWLFGWVCWKAKTPIKLTLKPDGGTAHEVKPIVVELDADVFHPLADLLGCAATFNLERPKNGRWRLEVSASDITLNVPVREPDTSQVWSSVPVRSGPRVNEVTVIVPIYDNALSTMSCLGAVRRQRSLGLPYRTIVVNDASPNVSLVEAVRKRAADRGIRADRKQRQPRFCRIRESRPRRVSGYGRVAVECRCVPASPNDFETQCRREQR